MTQVSIIGTGTMGQAIAGVVTKGGNTVQVLGRADTDAVTGDVVVLAVPYPAVADVLATRGDQLAGKVVVDITNPLNFETFDSLTVPADSSATAEIAAALPQSRVVKAFNTTFAGPLVNGEVDGEVLDVLMAGDDDDAKATLAAFVEAAGLRPIDVGGLSMAHWLEGLGLIGMAVAAESGNWGRIIKFLG
jgi:8-hydroxy-5-deazaflavin:NADPH oxidoreductase